MYTGSASLLTPGVTVLPPGCTSGCVTATADGSYPGVFNNVLADGSFGITSPIFLNEVTPAGRWSARCGYRTGRGLVSRAAPGAGDQLLVQI